MSEQTSQEPTMEEILASIRRIISEDDTPAGEEAEAAPAEGEPAAEAAAWSRSLNLNPPWPPRRNLSPSRSLNRSLPLKRKLWS